MKVLYIACLLQIKKSILYLIFIYCEAYYLHFDEIFRFLSQNFLNNSPCIIASLQMLHGKQQQQAQFPGLLGCWIRAGRVRPQH